MAASSSGSAVEGITSRNAPYVTESGPPPPDSCRHAGYTTDSGES